MAKTPTGGRPRSEQAQQAILAAAHELLQEGGGSALTIEAIARRARVGKPTIYRWWPSLADIVLEALLQHANDTITVPPFTNLRDTLHQFLCLSMQAINHGAGLHLRFLMAQAQKDEDFRQRFRDNFVASRRATLRAIFQEAVVHNQIHAEQNLDLLVDIVFGAKWYRLLTGHAPMNQTFANELTEIVMTLCRASPAPYDNCPQKKVC